MSKIRKRQNKRSRDFGFEKLEPKRCLASLGWDGPGQGSAELSYYIGDTPAQIDQATFDSVIEQALEAWSDVVDINFTETATPGQADSLDITFTSIDGSGGVLARAYFPDDVNRSRIAGDIQFDSAENWEVGNAQGSNAFDLLYVAVHEIGHALGLEHSDSSGSVLGDSVSPNQQFTGLTDGDRDEALELYAPASTDVEPDSPTIPVEQPDTQTPEQTPSQEVDPEPADPETNDDNNPEETDSGQQDRFQRRYRWNHFRRWRVRIFNYFNDFNGFTFDSPSDSQTDSTDVEQANRSPFRTVFKIRFFRGFR